MPDLSRRRPLIVFVGINDWANVCNGWTRAINAHSQRFRARCVIMKPHIFGYEQDITIGSSEPTAMVSAAAVFSEAAIIVYASDGDYMGFDWFDCCGLDRRGRVLCTWHTGTAYRTGYEMFNDLDRRWDFALRLITPNCYHLAGDGPPARPGLPAVDFDVQPQPEDPTVICHSPSNPLMKGTPLIQEVIESLPLVRSGEVEWRLIHGLDYQSCIRQKHGATLFVDQVIPSVGGFGLSGLEAMGLGAACLCSVNNIVAEIDKWWSRPPILNIQSADDLRQCVNRLLDDRDELFDRRLACWRWIQDTASPAAAAARFDDWFAELV